MNKNKIIRIVLIFFGIFFLANLAVTLMNTKEQKPTDKYSYTQFVDQVKQDKVQSVLLDENTRGPRQMTVKLKDSTSYKIITPQDANIVSEMLNHHVELKTVPEDKPGFWESLLYNWGSTILFIAVWLFFMRKMMSGKGAFSFGKSKAQIINPEDINISFKDVVGCDEAKREAQEFVDFLKSPEKFNKLGGKTPRGVLLTGPAGTGKTMIAKALAKESGVSFLSLSGSEFVEMFVGVGAARVRDMFKTAKENAPCVIFIDEIDAIGAARGRSQMGGSNDEREQTLNQILVELDGFDTHKGVILVAATNRPEILDKALLRPGRIDRQIVVALPDVYGREEILKIHSKDVPLSKDVDLTKIARGTPGFSGAELANLVNEAAIFAARENKADVDQTDFEKAKDKIMMGVERPSLAMSLSDKKDTAYHESGHAVVAKLLKNADPVHKVTIIPRGRALGLTMQLPEEDRWSYKMEYLQDKITILMGGRAAEEIFCNTRTNGASNDIAVATNIARSMVSEWGMSDLGPIAFGNREGSSFLDGGLLSTTGLSQATLEQVEHNIHELINREYRRAKMLLEENKDIVEAMTEALMNVETIDDWQIENLMQRRPYDDKAGLTIFKEMTQEREKELAQNRKRFGEKGVETQTPNKVQTEIKDSPVVIDLDKFKPVA